VAEEQKDKSISELIVELLDLTNRYIRQEIGRTIEDSVARPLRRAGKWLALAIIASTLFAVAIIFIAVATFQLLAIIVGATWVAYLIIGGILLLSGIAVVVWGVASTTSKDS
jgi:hypothetical protein